MFNFYFLIKLKQFVLVNLCENFHNRSLAPMENFMALGIRFISSNYLRLDVVVITRFAHRLSCCRWPADEK